jgi:hypothetical protein
MEIRSIHNGLITYLKEAKKKGTRAFLKRDTLVVNGRIHEMEYLRKNVQIAVES